MILGMLGGPPKGDETTLTLIYLETYLEGWVVISTGSVILLQIHTQQEKYPALEILILPPQYHSKYQYKVQINTLYF